MLCSNSSVWWIVFWYIICTRLYYNLIILMAHVHYRNVRSTWIIDSCHDSSVDDQPNCMHETDSFQDRTVDWHSPSFSQSESDGIWYHSRLVTTKYLFVFKNMFSGLIRAGFCDRLHRVAFSLCWIHLFASQNSFARTLWRLTGYLLE